MTVWSRAAAAAFLALSGYLHAELYVHGYRVIPHIGTLFLIQASGSFALAVLLPFTTSPPLRFTAVGLAAGALGGFALSRTVGVLGFTEHGWEPAPQALLSVLAETTVLILIVPGWLRRARRP